MKYATMKQIAEIVGVSVNTVSRALNGKPDVSEKTRQKVLDVARRLGYVPNRLALYLKGKKTRIVGVIVEDNSNPFWSEVLKGVEAEAKLHGYHVILVNTNKNYRDEVEGIQMLLERRVDGILIAPNQRKYDDLLELKKIGIPFVIVGRHIKELENLDIPMVYSDEIKGGYIATKHLVERGCKRIAFIGAQPYNTASAERYEGYKRALRDAGIEMKEELIRSTGIEMKDGYRSVMDLLKGKARFDGVFAYNDLIAFGVLKALKEANLRVPEDIKVVGYDDVFYSSLITPSLTTVRVEKKEMGKLAFKMVLDFNHKRKEVLPVKVVKREST